MGTTLKAALIGAALALTASSVASAEEQKVCFVYVGPTGDNGWTYRHDVARKELEERFSGKIETTYVENISPGPDAERALTQYSVTGCKLIFATTFGYMEPVLSVAQKFPDTKFEHATGFKGADNVTTYDVRYYEAFYVEGKIAASVSETGIAGYIASFPIPVSLSSINAFMLGAQSVNPDFQLKVTWINSWYDPAKETDATNALIDQGADVIVQQTDSAAPMAVAEERGKLAFGMSADKIEFGPNAQLTTLVLNWAPYYERRVNALLDGSWQSQASYDGFAEGTLKLAELTNMSDETKEMALSTIEEIESGQTHPFQGPVYNQNGELVVEEGEILPTGAILGMDWFVQGITDSLPN